MAGAWQSPSTTKPLQWPETDGSRAQSPKDQDLAERNMPHDQATKSTYAGPSSGRLTPSLVIMHHHPLEALAQTEELFILCLGQGLLHGLPDPEPSLSWRSQGASQPHKPSSSSSQPAKLGKIPLKRGHGRLPTRRALSPRVSRRAPHQNPGHLFMAPVRNHPHEAPTTRRLLSARRSHRDFDRYSAACRARISIVQCQPDRLR